VTGETCPRQVSGPSGGWPDLSPVFECAIEGVEQEVYKDGEVVGARLVHDNRLLKYLLSHLKPERYGATAAERLASASSSGSSSAEPVPALEAGLRAMAPTDTVG
jgi:hypothetical protein